MAQQFENANLLALYLNGGAEMVETVMNHIAFRFYRSTSYSVQGGLVGYNVTDPGTPMLPSSSPSKIASAKTPKSLKSTSTTRSSSFTTGKSSATKSIKSTKYATNKRSTLSTRPTTASVAAKERAAAHVSLTYTNRKLADLYRIA